MRFDVPAARARDDRREGPARSAARSARPARSPDDGNPARLSPPGDAVLAAEVAALSGGARTLVERARALAAEGDFALASQLAEWAAQASPTDPKIRDARSEIYAAPIESETSLMARAIYRDASKKP